MYLLSGATLSKGINRAIGTVLGGGLGCMAAILADNSGEIGGALVVGISVIVIGKYCHSCPHNKVTKMKLIIRV